MYAKGATAAVISGNPIETGLAIEFYAGGAASSANHAVVVPPGRFQEPNGPGWQGGSSCRRSRCKARYSYLDGRGENGSIVFLRLDSRTGLFGASTRLIARASGQGNSPTIELTSPNPGDRGGIIVTVPGGSRICALFGGAAGGRITPLSNSATTFSVRHTRTAVPCPLPSGDVAGTGSNRCAVGRNRSP